jgi:O-antigen/teichoic acid export membrane protein
MGWMSVSSVGSAALGLMNTMLLTRFLGSEDYGYYLLALTFVSFFTPLCDMGSKAVAIKEAGCYPEQRGALSSSLLMLNFALGCVAFVLCWLCAAVLIEDRALRWAVGIMSFDLLLSRLMCCEAMLMSMKAFKHIALVRFASSLFLLLANICVVWLAGPFWVLLVTSLMGNVVLGLGLFWSSRQRCPMAWEAPVEKAKTLAREGWPLGCSAMASTLYLKVDLFLLSLWCPVETVSHYGAATKLMFLIYLFGQTAVDVFFPTLVQEHQKCSDRFEKKLGGFIFALLGLSLGIAILSSSLAEPAVIWVFGDDFKPSAQLLLLLAWSTLPVFLTSLARSCVTLTAQNFPVLKWTMEGLLLNVVLNTLLIPEWGGSGAAVATLMSDLLMLWRADVALRALRQKGLWSAFWMVFQQKIQRFR